MPAILRKTVAVAVAAAALATPAAADAYSGDFRTPTGNIVCSFHTGYHGVLYCGVRSAGVSYFLNRRGYPSSYRGTRNMYPHRVLRYGNTLRAGSFACRSRFAGPRCTNRSGHGFFLSIQERYRF